MLTEYFRATDLIAPPNVDAVDLVKTEVREEKPDTKEPVNLQRIAIATSQVRIVLAATAGINGHVVGRKPAVNCGFPRE